MFCFSLPLCLCVNSRPCYVNSHLLLLQIHSLPLAPCHFRKKNPHLFAFIHYFSNLLISKRWVLPLGASWTCLCVNVQHPKHTVYWKPDFICFKWVFLILLRQCGRICLFPKVSSVQADSSTLYLVDLSRKVPSPRVEKGRKWSRVRKSVVWDSVSS